MNWNGIEIHFAGIKERQESQYGARVKYAIAKVITPNSNATCKHEDMSTRINILPMSSSHTDKYFTRTCVDLCHEAGEA